MYQPENQLYQRASLAVLPEDMQRQIALQLLTGSPNLQHGLQVLLKLARSNKQLFNLLTNEPFLDQVKKLIQQRNQQAELNTLFMKYSNLGNVYAVAWLIKLGAHVDTIDIDGRTALIFAADRGNTEIIRVLLAAQANTDLVDKRFGWTALMRAVIMGQAETVRVLLDAGADIRKNDRLGAIILNHARNSGSEEIKQLIQDAINKL